MKTLSALVVAVACVFVAGGASASDVYTETWTVIDTDVNGAASVNGDTVNYAVFETGTTPPDVNISGGVLACVAQGNSSSDMVDLIADPAFTMPIDLSSNLVTIEFDIKRTGTSRDFHIVIADGASTSNGWYIAINSNSDQIEVGLVIDGVASGAAFRDMGMGDPLATDDYAVDTVYTVKASFKKSPPNDVCYLSMSDLITNLPKLELGGTTTATEIDAINIHIGQRALQEIDDIEVTAFEYSEGEPEGSCATVPWCGPGGEGESEPEGGGEGAITEGTPVTGMLGLGLITAACALGGTFVSRRK